MSENLEKKIELVSSFYSRKDAEINQRWISIFGETLLEYDQKSCKYNLYKLF